MSHIIACFHQPEEKGGPGEQATQGAVETRVCKESQPGRGQSVSWREDKKSHCNTEYLDYTTAHAYIQTGECGTWLQLFADCEAV